LRILVGITGGIAAYKSASLVRLLTEAGHDVKVLPTQNALRFIGSATLEALSHNSVDPNLYSQIEDVKHISLAQEAELIVVAPATASFIARYANGLADDLLMNVLLATKARVLIAPAMHSEMWLNPATQTNVATLKARGIEILEPKVGRLTGSDTGVGRMAEPEEIFAVAMETGIASGELSGKTVIVAAGGTHEPIDSVRFIGNRSSGKQGLALAKAAKARGADVLLINCNMSVGIPKGIEVIEAETAEELLEELSTVAKGADYIFMPVAVGDYRVEIVVPGKIKKEDNPELSLTLVKNPDVLASVSQMLRDNGSKTKIIGFAAEATANTDELIESAKKKLDSKGVQFIVANDISDGKTFGSDDSSVQIISRARTLGASGSKDAIANAILDFVLSDKEPQ